MILVKSLKNKYTDFILMGILSLISGFVLTALLKNASPYGQTYGIVASVFTIASFFVLLYFKGFYLKNKEDAGVRVTVISAVSGFLFALTLVLGYNLQYANATYAGISGKALSFAMAIFLNVPLFPLFWIIIYKLVKAPGVSFDDSNKARYAKNFFISFGVIFVLFIPAFLAYYPMILSYDFHAQVLMAEQGFEAIWNHHPYLSTLEISLFYHIGKAIGNTQTGMAFMGIFHMLVSAASYAYAVTVISKLIPKKWVPYVATAILGLFPTNPVMVLSTTKDVIFSDFFLVFICLLVERFVIKEGKRKILYDIFIVLTGIMTCQWRNNTLYALVVSGILLVIFVKKNRKLPIFLLTALIILGNFCTTALLRDVVIHDKHKPNNTEMMSVVVQAYGRVWNYNYENLDPEVKAVILNYINEEALFEYNKSISDTLKSNLTRNYYENLDKNLGKVLKDFLFVFKKYPDQVIDSFLDTTRGLWFIDDTSYADVLGDGLEGRMGIIYTYYSSASWEVEEIKHESKLPSVELFYEKLISRNDCLKWPILNNFFKTSFYTLIMFFIMAVYFVKKDYAKLGLIVFPIFYILTMFLGPVVQFRYVYPWMLASYVYTALLFSVNKDSIGE